MGCGEQVTNWNYLIQSSFALHSLHFELSHISLSVSLDSLLYHLFLGQSSITAHVQRSTRPKGTCFKHQLHQRVARKSQVEVCERRRKSFIKYFKEPIIKMLRRNTPYGNIIYILRLLENDRKTSFITDLFSRSRYNWYYLLMEDTRKGYLLSKIVYSSVRDWTSRRSLSEQSFIE